MEKRRIMTEKWGNSVKRSDSQSIDKKWKDSEPMYKPKLLTHSPSLRAMRNYNDLPIDGTSPGTGQDNQGYEADFQYEYYIHPDYTVNDGSNSKTSNYEYPTMSTVSLKTVSGGSELNSNVDTAEMGSSVKLVTEKVERSCQTWCSHISTIICTISIAMGLGNLYRLPNATLVHGGLPFLVIYAILTVIIGLPLLFLELGVGQMAQEGFIKSWRAVPFFKGIGYIKLLAGCFLSIYYPLYMGLAIMYLIWVLKGTIPFAECNNGVVITEDGYTATPKNGQECLRSTFIKRPFEDPVYFGIYTAVLFFIWVIVTLISIKRTKSYIRSLLVLFFPTLACYIALTTKSILLESELSVLWIFFQNVDWSLLGKAEIWYYATIQIFFSTNIGFGSFVTNAGIMYNKVNPLWTALGYISTNLLFGTGTVIISSILTQNVNLSSSSNPEITEVNLFASIYDSILAKNNTEFTFWMIALYLLFVFSGLVSMATLTYTLLKAIYGHDGIRLKRWQTSLIFGFCGFFFGTLVLLRYDFELVRLLDHYVVGNLILVTVVIEVIAFVAFYGTTRLQSDFEFILGRLLSKFWLFLWWFIPIFLTAIFVWGLVTLPFEGTYKEDSIWLYAVGWSMVLIAFLFVFVMGVFVMRKQDGYTAVDKLKASLEPSHNWGPKDPMLRHEWVQWNTKSQTGERDFTLKRRGTKDYTRTIKKKAKKEARELTAMSIAGAYFQRDVNSLGRPSNNNISSIRIKPRLSNEGNGIKENNRLSNGGNYDELYYVSSEMKNNIDTSPERNSLQKDIARKYNHHHHSNRNTYPEYHTKEYQEEHVRQSYPVKTSKKIQDSDDHSEGYGTFRNKGPYVIEGDDIGHVCYRKYSKDEEVTEL
ncbi:sodium-dependent nutrient amino acid transporter 1-like isoform X1 [Sitophilus oryzae]|uniref:Sodium-dependent nutrient amino acid transporter 1-like isoform X1 n=1 Tax=Sitophilus oryzae TaxID=7048 RepID=A0A6J2XR68_SITOR|nr:sodium-dependent nutrient amino acid transporter 1-like isoform X1 [Sitophilus oryzae]